MDRLFFKADPLKVVRRMSYGQRSTLDNGFQISGFAAVYNTLSSSPVAFTTDETPVYERLALGAFDRVLRTNPDVVCVFNHDANLILGRTTAGTLKLAPSTRGLAYTCDLPNTLAAQTLQESIKRGDVTGSSFAFLLKDGDFSFTDEKVDGKRCYVRTVHNISTLLDVSPCTNPKYSDTSVGARSVVIPAQLPVRASTRRPPLPPGKSMQDMIEEERDARRICEIEEFRVVLENELRQQHYAAVRDEFLQ